MGNRELARDRERAHSKQTQRKREQKKIDREQKRTETGNVWGD